MAFVASSIPLGRQVGGPTHILCSCIDPPANTLCYYYAEYGLVSVPANITLRTGCSAQDLGQTISSTTTSCTVDMSCEVQCQDFTNPDGCCGDTCGWGDLPANYLESCRTNGNTRAVKQAAVSTVKANIQAALNSTINIVALLKNISAVGVDPSQ